MRITSQVSVVALLAATFMLSSVAAHAQNARVRGTIEKLDGNVLTVKSRDGAELKLTLKDDARIAGVVKAALADVKPDSNVAITSRPRPDGTLEAYELRIAPAGQQFNSFHSDNWDLMPNSKMTNGALQTSIAGVDGQVLTVKYKVQGKPDEEKQLIVTPKTIIATTVAGTKADLKPGLKVFVAAAPKLPDGSLDVGAIQVEKEIPPPQ
jgi:hypothetical protein